MATYRITAPNGKTYTVSGEGTAEEARAQLEQQLHGQSTEQFKKKDFWPQVWQRFQDESRAGIEGVTLGLASKGAAGLNSWLHGTKMDDELGKQRWDRDEAKARLNATGNPGTYEAMELAGSLINPLGRIGNAALPAKTGNLARGLVYGTEGAATGAASAYGHDQNPLAGAGVGAVAGAALPWTAEILPHVAKGVAPGLGTAGGIIGHQYFGWPGAMAGGAIGTGVGVGAQLAADTIADKTVNTQGGRALLAELASAPSRLYGWAADRFGGQ